MICSNTLTSRANLAGFHFRSLAPVMYADLHICKTLACLLNLQLFCHQTVSANETIPRVSSANDRQVSELCSFELSKRLKINHASMSLTSLRCSENLSPCPKITKDGLTERIGEIQGDTTVTLGRGKGSILSTLALDAHPPIYLRLRLEVFGSARSS
jgi:hypothetical protein